MLSISFTYTVVGVFLVVAIGDANALLFVPIPPPSTTGVADIASNPSQLLLATSSTSPTYDDNINIGDGGCCCLTCTTCICKVDGDVDELSEFNNGILLCCC